MTGYELAEILIEEQGYAASSAFERSVTWPNGRPIPGVDNAYLIQGVPVIYFSRLSDADPDRLWRLHKDVWNQSKAPLLYVILPQEIRIYNGYAEPAETPRDFIQGEWLLQRLEQLTDVETARQRIRNELGWYDRLHLDTGAFWISPDGQKIRREGRADQRLLRAVDQVRRHLLSSGLSNDMAYALLGRSILICYLEDRGILTPELMSQMTDGQADTYHAVLDDLDATYRLFEQLTQRFNGDLFPVDELERGAVQQEHLNLLRDFLGGRNLDSGQTSFWPYDFQHIPIEFVSGIYDTFLNRGDRRRAGTYYTPLSLVDFILDQTLPVKDIDPDLTILDPACGSGVFLVRAYQRMVAAWRRQNDGEKPTDLELKEILQRSIFGVDIDPSAIRIATFNLYLAMIDNLDNQAILTSDFRFPPLIDTNLMIADFFASEVDDQFADIGGFDRVIGNPPWGKGTLAPTSVAQRYVNEHDLAVGGRQIVQAFLHKAPTLCTDGGKVAMLAPAKSTVLVSSETHAAFRQQFFERYDVETVVNFSALRYELFDDAFNPAVALFYRPGPPELDRRIVYGVPKPSPLSQRLDAIVLDPTEIKYLDQQELVENPFLWKTALWGSSRDAALIERLVSLPSLGEKAAELGWRVAEGIQIGGGDQNPASWLEGMPLLPTRQFRRYVLDMDACGTIEETVFHRPRTPDIVRGPLALIRQSPIEKRCAAAFSADDVIYRHMISGVVGQTGQETLLKWLVAYVNSPLAQYYHFLTSTLWAVERGTILQNEYLQMPFLIPEQDDPRLAHILDHFEQIVTLLQRKGMLADPSTGVAIEGHEGAIAELVFDLYDLTPAERQLVHDMADYGIDYFYWSKRKQRRADGTRAVRPPDAEMLIAYAHTFVETVTTLLRYQGQTLRTRVYLDGAPLSVVAFELISLSDACETRVTESTDELKAVLRDLDGRLLEQHTPALYMRRHVRLYDGNRLYLVRPSEQRFWTRSQALADADSAVLEWLSRPQPTQE